MGQHLVTHDPCDLSDFRDPFDPWPMTHRPIPCSGADQSLKILPELLAAGASLYATIQNVNGSKCVSWPGCARTRSEAFSQTPSCSRKGADGNGWRRKGQKGVKRMVKGKASWKGEGKGICLHQLRGIRPCCNTPIFGNFWWHAHLRCLWR